MGKPKECSKCGRIRDNHVGTHMGRRCPLAPQPTATDHTPRPDEEHQEDRSLPDTQQGSGHSRDTEVPVAVTDPAWAEQERALQNKLTQLRAEKQRQANEAAHHEKMQALLREIEALEKPQPRPVPISQTAVAIPQATASATVPLEQHPLPTAAPVIAQPPRPSVVSSLPGQLPAASAATLQPNGAAGAGSFPGSQPAWSIPPLTASGLTVPPQQVSLAHLRQDQTLNSQAESIMYSTPAASVLPPMTNAKQPQGKQPYFPSIEGQVHRSGVAEVQFDKLSFAEVTLGVTRLLGSPTPPPHVKQGLLHLLTTVASKASKYKWPVVRAFMAVALKEIKSGEKQWCQDLSELECDMLKPSDLLPTNYNNNGSNVTVANICGQWNFSECPRLPNCYLNHYCKDCFTKHHKLENHKAKACPLRKQAPGNKQ